MKFTLLALNLFAVASGNMAEDFVRNGSNNSNTSSPVERVTSQNAKNRGVKKNGKRVLRGTATLVDTAKAERDLKEKDDKENKNDDQKYSGGYSSGLNYFVPNNYDEYQNNKVDSKGFKEDDFNYETRPSASYDTSYGETKFKDQDSYDKSKNEAWQSDEDTYSYDKAKDDISKNDKSKYKDEEKAKAEKVNLSFEEETDAFVDTPDPTEPPTLLPTLMPTLEPISEVATGSPTFDEIVADTDVPTFSPTLNPSVASNSAAVAGSGESAIPTFSPSLEPTTALDSEVVIDVPTFSPTLTPTATGEEASFAAATGYPTFDETSVPTAPGNETSTLSTSWSVSTAAWDSVSRPSSWGEAKPERTRRPKTPEPSSLFAPTPAPTLMVTSSMIASSGAPAASLLTPFPTADLASAGTSSTDPTVWPTYSPASHTYSPATGDENATTVTAATASGGASTFLTSTGATSSGSECTADFCEYELSSDYLMEYMLNVPEETNLEECDLCSVTIRLTYDGEVSWLGFAFSTDGQMIGSEAVIGNFMSGDEPGKYSLGGKYDGAIQPMDDSKQTLIDASIVVEDGQTIMTFTKQLKEDGEIEIFSGDNTFLWAHGDTDSASTYHGNNRSAFQINLLGNN